MLGYIDGFDFKEMEPQRYWAPPQSWPDEKKKTTTKMRVFSGEFWGAEKKDGYFMKFVKDDEGNMMLLSRSRNVKGEFPNKIEWVPHLQPFFDRVPNGTCFLCEIYFEVFWFSSAEFFWNRIFNKRRVSCVVCVPVCIQV